MKETYVKSWLKDALGIFNLELVRLLRDGGVMIIFIVYAAFSLFQSKTTKGKASIIVSAFRER